MSDVETFDDPDVKLIILGDAAVGKSKLCDRFLQSDFNPRRMSTHAINIYRKEIIEDGNTGEELNTTCGSRSFKSTACS